MRAVGFLIGLVAFGLVACGPPPSSQRVAEGCRCAGLGDDGTMSLACGESRCVDGVGHRCDEGGVALRDPTACGACLPDRPCTPEGRPCSVGRTRCEGRVSACVEVDQERNGTSCGPDRICHAGECIACREGDVCSTQSECEVGRISCINGKESCLTSPRPDGSACSHGICQAGRCVSCTAGASCVPAPCRTGTLSCTGGSPQCVDRGPVANGTSCGPGQSCYGGRCVTCTAGASCTPSSPCYEGEISCATGAPTCRAVRPVPNGTSCGTGRVCSAGACVSCQTGASCTPPADRCQAGMLTCASGSPVCTPTGAPAPDGTACAAGSVCRAGQCVACAGGTSCTPADPCRHGQISCASGSAVCVAGANRSDGASCGPDAVCSGGRCVPCTRDASCARANPCERGILSCDRGPVCLAAGAVANGTSCGAGSVCNQGQCTACAAGGSCSTGDPCAVATWSCATGTQRCEVTGASGATSCGNVVKGTCSAGACRCPAGYGLFSGECQLCPAAGPTVYVNADPAVGADNQCCGATTTPGFGGPCRTLTQALANYSSNRTISVVGDSNGNASPTERYPLVLGSGVHVRSGKLPLCFPGKRGAAVVVVPGASRDGSLSQLYLGSDCGGTGSGATVGVELQPGSRVELDKVQIHRVETGLVVDGAALTLSGLLSHIGRDGILCRSTTTKASVLVGESGLTIRGAAGTDVRVGDNCTFTNIEPRYRRRHTLRLGDAPTCAVKADGTGVLIEGSGVVDLAGTVQIACMARDGIRLGGGSPSLRLDGDFGQSGLRIERIGCAGIAAENGFATVLRTVITSSQWAVLQRSSATSGSRLVSITESTLSCNGRGEPGACCTQASCPIGGHIFNNSGLPLIATGNTFDQNPLNICSCDAALTSCACSGGQTRPPAGVAVLNAPLSGGSPATDASGYRHAPATCQP